MILKELKKGDCFEIDYHDPKTEEIVFRGKGNDMIQLCAILKAMDAIKLCSWRKYISRKFRTPRSPLNNIKSLGGL